MNNYYLVLGIDKDADLDKIKHEYRFYCKKYHPDLSSKEEKNKFHKIQEAYETLSDEKDEFFEGFVSGFFKEDFSGDKGLYLELILTPEEAISGGDFTIEVPVLEECSVCLGKGYINRFICSFCNGTGTIHKKRSFILHVPANITSNTSTKVSLEGIGLPNVYINVDIVIASV